MDLPESLRYRPEIDGLRAIAVIAVVVFHVSPKILPGGFTGVDVFFVISGYLITRLILAERAKDGFRFTHFYARRVRRLFPSLLVVLLATWIFGALAFLPSEFSSLGDELVSAALFLTNFHFAADQGYFGLGAETRPLLHLWSLGVEEQFYLVWPALLALFPRPETRRRMFFYLGLASFTANLFGVWFSPVAAFYLPFGRLWEFLSGAIVCVVPREAWRGLEKFAGVGLLFLLAGFAFIGSATVFPGAWALLPTVGTVLLLLASPNSTFARFFALRPLRFVGEISYPLYLWHWPILVGLRVFIGYEPSLFAKSLGALAAFGLAWLTYRFVEIPIRFRRPPIEADRRMTGALVAILGLLGILGAGTAFFDGFPWRIEGPAPEIAQTARSFHKNAKIGRDCPVSVASQRGSFWCGSTSPNPPNRALVGDSHAQALLSTLEEGSAADVRWFVLAGPGCAPFLLEAGETPKDPCERFFADGLRAVLADEKIEWVLFVFHAHLATDPRNVARARETFRAVRARGKRPAILVDNPIPSMTPERCGRARPIEKLGVLPPGKCSISRTEHEEKIRGHRGMIALLRADDPGLFVFDPTDRLCDGEDCPVVSRGEALYSYTHHLSAYGARRFVPELLGEMAKKSRH